MAKRKKKKNSDEIEINITEIWKVVKKNYPYILLVLFVLFGYSWRIYHLGYPVIGYHNWKETHYLTEARNFARDGFFEHGFFIPEWDYPSLSADPSGAHPDTFPLTSIIVSVFFSLFGFSLSIARLLSVLFSVALIVVMYLVVKELYEREDLALLVAFLTAINPLFIFFGRQVQLTNYAVFFMMLSLYFYLKWRKNFNHLHITLFVLFFTIGLITKYDHFIILFPIIATFPYVKFFNDLIKNFTKYIPAFIFGLIGPAWILYTKLYNPNFKVGGLETSLRIIFNAEWLAILKSYIRDNYTLIGFLFAILGLFFVFLLLRKGFGNQFLAFFVGGGVIWTYILAPYLKGHSYHQYPIAPLIIILISFAFITIANTVKSLIPNKKISLFVKWLVIISLVFVIYNPSMEAKDRQFNTQFYGLDIAGEYINKNSAPSERLFHSGHQSYGVLWHADRKGISFPWNVTRIKKAEDELNFNWIFVYQWGMQTYPNNPQYKDAWNYVKENYELKQLAFIRTSQGDAPFYFLFKRGGSFNESNINSLVQNKAVNRKSYELTTGNFDLYYIDI